MHASYWSFAACLLAGQVSAAYLPLALLLIFGTAKLAGEICERLGQPGIVGEILAGVLLGPGVLHWVEPNDVITALAQMGAMFLLFRVGLDVKPPELMRVGGRALIVASSGVAATFLAAWAIMAAAGASRVEGVFVAAALVSTSAGITAHVLRSEGLIAERASQIILAAAVIDDVLGLLVLALVSNIAHGPINIPGLITTTTIAAGFVVFVASIGSRTLQQVLPKLEQKLAAQEAQFNLAMILLFALAVLAVYAGIAAIIGAFLAGMVLSDIVDHRVHDLAHGITELLVPFFLAGIGLHVDISVFRNSGTVWLTVFIFVAAVLCKLIGCGLGALRLGRADALRIGAGMVPRGEVGMIVAQLGLTLEIIHKPAYAAVVIVAVATTLLAPPLVKFAFASISAAPCNQDGSLEAETEARA
jgi:Kef-type K+ transport system membrane component KefB